MLFVSTLMSATLARVRTVNVSTMKGATFVRVIRDTRSPMVVNLSLEKDSITNNVVKHVQTLMSVLLGYINVIRY